METLRPEMVATHDRVSHLIHKVTADAGGRTRTRAVILLRRLARDLHFAIFVSLLLTVLIFFAVFVLILLFILVLGLFGILVFVLILDLW